MSDKAIAVVAGGCYWGTQFQFDKIPGVLGTRCGYMGGHVENPTYEEVCAENTGHAESVRIEYDPDEISYKELAKYLFCIHDPTTLNEQGIDKGTRYRSAIFYGSDEERAIAEKLIQRINKSGLHKNPVVTELIPAGVFYEEQNTKKHEDYYKRHPEEIAVEFCHPFRPDWWMPDEEDKVNPNDHLITGADDPKLQDTSRPAAGGTSGAQHHPIVAPEPF